MTLIRSATDADLPGILAITNDAILHGTALWLVTPVTLEARRSWMEERLARGFPVLVAQAGGEICGFGTYGTFRPFEGYALTVEHSLYVRTQAQRQGIGGALLDALQQLASAAGMHVMIAGIEASNAASIALHERAGFTRCGVLPQVGRKFDRWLDLLLMHKRLGDPRPDDPPGHPTPGRPTPGRQPLDAGPGSDDPAGA